MGLSHFPRSDPAIIVLVTDDQDRALLGRNGAWPEGALLDPGRLRRAG